MRIAGKTDKGFRRADNQDRYIAGALANGICFGFVCDGMGGANGGSVASGRLCRTLEECLFLENDNKAMEVEKTVMDAIDVACSRIYHQAQSNPALKGMGTTISGVTVKGDECTAYNAGDSRVYVLRGGNLTQITEDHSVVQQLFRQGAITEEEMATHPQKNLITRAVGVKTDVEVDVGEITLLPGDRILCASDGLTNFVKKEILAQILSGEDFYNIPKQLIDKALENNASDNITAVVLEY
ncbi:MAG: Stp1/IreP family PP2C-type Ser/Thr phosphatase [Oscillospiraceae bacterium]|nr:Stp1/IreP family PP2C-type Ser/Thr phosphatase [Oscillospiraceae bacterium]